MKALLIESDNGLEYDSYEHWVSAVFLVPDDFNPLKIRNQVMENATAQNLIRIKKDGCPYQDDWPKINQMFNDYLKNNFQEIPIFNTEK